MAVSAPVSLEAYLRTVYRPDCDFVDGVIEERNVGESDHSWIQLRIGGFFLNRFPETGIVAIPEWRFQVKSTRFRIPDLVVVRGRPNEQILTQPPLLCIEILSPDDTISRMNVRIQDYLDFGVPAVWLVDPQERREWIYRSDGMQEATGNSIRVDGTSIEVPRTEIFD